MKLLNILGAVIAVHIAVLVLAVAIPGCRSTDKSAVATANDDDPYAANPAPASSGIASAPELSDRDLNPPIASSAAPMFDPDAPAMSPAMAESYTAGGRYSPTRPGTTVATAMQAPAKPIEVTPAATYTVQRGDSLWALARKNNISVRELATANHLEPSAGLRLGQVLVIPGQAPAGLVEAVAAESPTDSVIYVVKSGDVLGSIARRNHTTVAELKAFNNLRSDLVRVGDRLAIPTAAEMPKSPAGALSGPSGSTPATPTAPVAGVTTAGDAPFKHTVAPGESLTLIAKRYGVKIGDLALANKIVDPSLIRPGQQLIIPGVKASTAAAVVAKMNAPTNAISAQTAARASGKSLPSGDLDAGLSDTTLDNVPVIPIEQGAGTMDTEPPIQTIDLGGGSPGGPPLFE